MRALGKQAYLTNFPKIVLFILIWATIALYRKIPSGDFDDFSSLETLDLEANMIASIASNAFAGLESVQRLYLEHTRLICLSHDTFQAMMRLKSLHLDYNKLYYLDKNLFPNNSMLKTLTLSSNQFGDFNRSTFDLIRSSIEIIDISLNFIACNCDSMWFVKDFEETLTNADNTFCSSQAQTLNSLRGKPLPMFIPDNYCYPNVWVHTLICLSITMTILIVIIAYRNSYRLKYQCFLLKPIPFLATLRLQMPRTLIILNMMWTSRSVIKPKTGPHFKPILQEQLPNFNRIAFDDDDLILGMHYFDAVYTNVKRSFKIVLLLTKKLSRITSSWPSSA